MVVEKRQFVKSWTNGNLKKKKNKSVAHDFFDWTDEDKRYGPYG